MLSKFLSLHGVYHLLRDELQYTLHERRGKKENYLYSHNPQLHGSYYDVIEQ